jgi:hypothetical protein
MDVRGDTPPAWRRRPSITSLSGPALLDRAGVAALAVGVGVALAVARLRVRAAQVAARNPISQTTSSAVS